MLRKTLTIFSLIGLLLSVACWSTSSAGNLHKTPQIGEELGSRQASTTGNESRRRGFTARVKSVSYLSRYHGPPPKRAAADPRFVVTLEVTEVDDSLDYKPGQELHYAVHSIAKLFRLPAGQVVGKSFQLTEEGGGTLHPLRLLAAPEDR